MVVPPTTKTNLKYRKIKIKLKCQFYPPFLKILPFQPKTHLLIRYLPCIEYSSVPYHG